jgi:hypothetical protein
MISASLVDKTGIKIEVMARAPQLIANGAAAVHSASAPRRIV